MNTRHIILHRALFFSFIFTAILCFHNMHAQVEDVSRGIGSRGPVLTFESIGRGDTVFAVTGSGQLFRSADTGRSWTLLHAFPAGEAICSLLGSDSELVAGFRNGTVLTSTDAGMSWTPVFRFNSRATVTDLTAHASGVLALSEHGGIAFRGSGAPRWDSIAAVPSPYCIDIMRTSDSVLLVGSHGEGIFISHDEGLSWTQPKQCPLSAMISDLERCPCGGILASTSDLSLYHSMDAGLTWELFEGGSCSGPKGRYKDLAIGGDSLIFVVGAVSVSFWNGHGRKWALNYSLIVPPRICFCLADGNLLIGDYLGGIHRSIAEPFAREATDYVCPVDNDLRPVLAPGEQYPFKVVGFRRLGRRNQLIRGTVHVRNTLTGEEFTAKLDTVFSRNPTFIVTAPEHAAEGEYALEYRLVDSPHDKGIVSRHTFSVRHIERSRQIREVYRAQTKYGFKLLHGTVSGELYCRDGDGTLLQSRDRGKSWHNILPPEYAEQSIYTVAGDGQTALYAITYDFLLLVSHDGGVSWERETRLGKEVRDVTARGKWALALADGDIYYSQDTARSWKRITPFIGSLYFDLHIMEHGDPLLSYAQGLVTSSDGGNFWVSVRTPFGRDRIPRLLVTSDDEIIIPRSRLYRSTDLGHSWSYDLDRDIRLGYLKGVVETSDGRIFARNDKGNPVVYLHQNGTWQNDLAVPDSLRYHVDRIRSVGNTIAISTRNDRLYIRPADAITSVRQPQQPREFRITSTSPNPFSATAQITIDNETERILQLQVYDMLGRCRATLHDGRLRAGYSTFRLNGSGLPAGPYLVVLRDGASVHTRKITLIH